MATLAWDDIQKLAVRALQGDADSYRQFLSVLAQRLKPRFYKILPESCVEDALQETLMAVHKSLHTLDTQKPLGPWINAIAHYKIQDQLRQIYKNSGNRELIEESLPAAEKSLSAAPAILHDLLARLPERERKILELLKLEERSVVDVAQLLGMTPANVKVVTFRAMQKLRGWLAREEFYEN